MTVPVFAGVDEAGRGPMAGPVVAAAAILTAEQASALSSLGLRDSKKMTSRSREAVFSTIKDIGVIWTAQVASVERIDRMNILYATLWAMKKAVERLPRRFFDGVLVDGDKEIPGLNLPQQVCPGGDDKYPQISAASVIAKVLRDGLMVALDKKYPKYGLAQHKGYGTKAHRRALELYGVTAIHRRSFHWRTPS
ncbi:MAG: ribonuclease HII [Dethiosulfovibrio peptidovorans]|nr:MAG: ribonuclease HII [Dethiosulfovibrio peptidovorans]